MDEKTDKPLSSTLTFKEPEKKIEDSAPGLLDATDIEEWKSNVPTKPESPNPPKPESSPAKQTPPKKNLLEPKNRVDYLAGLVAVSSLLVTAIHFCLTFVVGTVNAGAFTHYYSQTIARKFLNSYFLDLLWIGPFLMTSTRFLVASYLRTGELLPVAEKTVGRAPRLMIPVVAMVLFEYFLINAGATKWLEYLPSITWSTWQFTSGFTNFGNFISELGERHPYEDRQERLSNVIKTFKHSLSNYTGASSISNPFSEIVIKAPRFNLIISRLTNNTYVLVVLPPGGAGLQCARFNIMAARTKFASTDIGSTDTRIAATDKQTKEDSGKGHWTWDA